MVLLGGLSELYYNNPLASLLISPSFSSDLIALAFLAELLSFFSTIPLALSDLEFLNNLSSESYFFSNSFSSSIYLLTLSNYENPLNYNKTNILGILVVIAAKNKTVSKNIKSNTTAIKNVAIQGKKYLESSIVNIYIESALATINTTIEAITKSIPVLLNFSTFFLRKMNIP